MNKRVTVRQRKQTNKQTSDERKDRDTSQIRRPLDPARPRAMHIHMDISI